MNIRKWAFIYTLDDGSTEPRVDELCGGLGGAGQRPAERAAR
jgi:hypothetical protein